jgi:hypothetical protein
MPHRGLRYLRILGLVTRADELRKKRIEARDLHGAMHAFER